MPVQAFTTDSLYLGIGQRYDVTIDASQNPGNYWIICDLLSYRCLRRPPATPPGGYLDV